MERSARRELPPRVLMLVTDGVRRRGPAAIEDIVRDAVRGGVNIVQLREKHMAGAELVELGLRVRDVIAGEALLFVNSDVEAAIALGADGVHLPDGAGSVAEVRARCGEGVLVSRSVHDAEAAVRAEREGADFALLGTVFETASKPGTRTIGVEGARAACNAVAIPVVAIGGITASNAARAIGAGAAGVAVIGALLDADDPLAAARSLAAAISIATPV